MNETQRYLIGEHIEDFEDGLITRRELLRRAGLIMGSATAGLAAVVTLGCNLERPAAATATPTPQSASPSASPAVGYATPPPSPTTDGITIKADDARIVAQSVAPSAADGAALIGYLARPKADGKYPGVLVVHENRGMQEHIRDVIRRVATAGFVGIGIDLLSRQGGAEKLADQAAYNAALSARARNEMVADEKAAIVYLQGQPFVDAAKIGVVGFCFGGGMTWSVLAAGIAVQAAAPFYGPAPSNIDDLAKTKAAVSAVYAETDAITSSKDQIEAQLRKTGAPYQLIVYPGVGHAFHNDTGARYNAAQAQKAWVATIDWFRKYLA